jgi:hypothetical protein
MSEMGLGRVKTPFPLGEKPGPVRSQATITAISGLVPTMFMIRVRLEANNSLIPSRLCAAVMPNSAKSAVTH